MSNSTNTSALEWCDPLLFLHEDFCPRLWLEPGNVFFSAFLVLYCTATTSVIGKVIKRMYRHGFGDIPFATYVLFFFAAGGLLRISQLLLHVVWAPSSIPIHPSVMFWLWGQPNRIIIMGYIALTAFWALLYRKLSVSLNMPFSNGRVMAYASLPIAIVLLGGLALNIYVGLYPDQEYFRIYFAADFVLNAVYTLVIAVAFPYCVYRVTPLQGEGEVARRMKIFAALIILGGIFHVVSGVFMAFGWELVLTDTASWVWVFPMGFFFIGELIYISLGAYFLRGGAIYEGTLAVREAPTAEVTIRPDKGRAVGIEGRQINTVVAKDGTTRAAPTKGGKRTVTGASTVASTTGEVEETAVPVSAGEGEGEEMKATEKKKRKKTNTYGQRVEFTSSSTNSKTTRGGTTRAGTTTKASSTTTKGTSTHGNSTSDDAELEYFSDSDEEVEKKGTVVILARESMLWSRIPRTARDWFRFPSPIDDIDSRIKTFIFILYVVLHMLLDRFLGIYQFLYYVAIDSSLRIFFAAKFNPESYFVFYLIRPYIYIHPQYKPPLPKRVAVTVASAMMIVSLVLRIYNYTFISNWILATFISVALLDVIFAICVPCAMFSLAMVLGILPESVCRECRVLFKVERAKKNAKGEEVVETEVAIVPKAAAPSTKAPSSSSSKSSERGAGQSNPDTSSQESSSESPSSAPVPENVQKASIDSSGSASSSGIGSTSVSGSISMSGSVSGSGSASGSASDSASGSYSSSDRTSE